MADRGSGTGDARPNLSNQAYRPDAEPPAAGPGQSGGTSLPGVATFGSAIFFLLLARPFGLMSYQGHSTPAPATPNDADPDDADRLPEEDPLGDVLRACWPPAGVRTVSVGELRP